MKVQARYFYLVVAVLFLSQRDLGHAILSRFFNFTMKISNLSTKK